MRRGLLDSWKLLWYLLLCFYASSLRRVDNLCETFRNQWLANCFSLPFDLLAYLSIKSEENSAFSQKIMQLNLSKPQIFVAMYIVTTTTPSLLLLLPPASHKFGKVLSPAPTPSPCRYYCLWESATPTSLGESLCGTATGPAEAALLLLLLLQDARSQDQKQAAASPAAVAAARRAKPKLQQASIGTYPG